MNVLNACEMIHCVSNRKNHKLIRVNENMEDGSWSVYICEKCATKLGISTGQDIPENANEILLGKKAKSNS